MKLLHVIPSVHPKAGGPIEGIKQRGVHLKQLGHQAEVLCLDDPDSDEVRNFPLTTHALGPSRGFYAYNTKLTPWLKENSKYFDKIIIHGLWQYHSYATAKTLKRLNVPYYLFTHGMLDPWFRHEYKIKHLKKLIYWIAFERKTVNGAQKVLFTSHEECTNSRNSFPLYSPNEAIVSYGTNTPPEATNKNDNSILKKFPELSSTRNIIFLSRVDPKKGCDIAIEAFAKYVHDAADNSIRLLIAGPGEESYISHLKCIATRLSVETRIYWLGLVTGPQKWDALHASEAFILPSHQENFGIAVVEALGCGLPVITTNKVNIWQEIQQDNAGIISNDDTDSITKSLHTWFGMSHEIRAKIAKNAKQSFLKRFTIEEMATGLLNELKI